MPLSNNLFEIDEDSYHSNLPQEYKNLEVVNLDAYDFNYADDDLLDTLYGSHDIDYPSYDMQFLTNTLPYSVPPIQPQYLPTPVTVLNECNNVSQTLKSFQVKDTYVTPEYYNEIDYNGIFNYKNNGPRRPFKPQRKFDWPMSNQNYASNHLGNDKYARVVTKPSMQYLNQLAPKSHPNINRKPGKSFATTAAMQPQFFTSTDGYLIDDSRGQHASFHGENSVLIKLFKLECNVCHGIREYIVQITKPSRSRNFYVQTVETSFVDEIHLFKSCALHKNQLRETKSLQNIFLACENETEDIELKQPATSNFLKKSRIPDSFKDSESDTNIEEGDNDTGIQTNSELPHDRDDEPGTNFWFQREFLKHADCVSFTDYDNLNYCISTNNNNTYVVDDPLDCEDEDDDNTGFDEDSIGSVIASSSRAEAPFRVEIEITSLTDSDDDHSDLVTDDLEPSISHMDKQKHIDCECGESVVHI